MKTGKSKDHLQRVFLRFLYLIMGSILSLDSVMAQENLKISGQVTDNKGEAIIGASVKSSENGYGLFRIWMVSLLFRFLWELNWR